ncbi:MAG: riboflavin synthase [bacterium]
MFSGIIEEVGIVEAVQEQQGALRLTIAATEVLNDLTIDDSISVNGVCLTVIKTFNSNFQVVAVEETLKKTTLALLQNGSKVNLERSLRLADRIGGHLVQGHVDGVGKVAAIHPGGYKLSDGEGGRLISIEVPMHLMKYIISEGSIAIDGVSLTVARLSKNLIIISLIPHTLNKTTFGHIKVGGKVNIEVDLIGKYVERMLSKPEESKISEEWLHKIGY